MVHYSCRKIKNLENDQSSMSSNYTHSLLHTKNNCRNTWFVKEEKTNQNRNKKILKQKRVSSYPNAIPLVTDLRPAEKPREPGAELLDEGLDTTGGRWISRSESPILSAVLGSASVLCTVSLEKWYNSLLLFGRVDRLLEEPHWDLCSSGGSLSCWSIHFAKQKKVSEKELNKTSFIGQIWLASTKFFENVSSLNNFLLVAKLEARVSTVTSWGLSHTGYGLSESRSAYKHHQGQCSPGVFSSSIVAWVNKKFLNSLLLIFNCKPFSRLSHSGVRCSFLAVWSDNRWWWCGWRGVTKITETRQTADGNRGLCYTVIVES